MKIKNEKTKLLKYLAIITIAIFLTSVSVLYYQRSFRIYKVHELGIDVYVDSVSGFNVDSDAIHFGKVMPGSVGQRNIVIDNDNAPHLIAIELDGDISEWVSVSDNDFIMEANESTDVTVFVSIPVDAENPSFRKGTLKIIFKRV